MTSETPLPHHFLGKYQFTIKGDWGLTTDGDNHFFRFKQGANKLTLQAYEVGRLGDKVACKMRIVDADKILYLSLKQQTAGGRTFYALAADETEENAATILWSGFNKDMLSPASKGNHAAPLADGWHVVPAEVPNSGEYLPIRLSADGYLCYSGFKDKLFWDCVQTTDSWYDLKRNKQANSAQDFQNINFQKEDLTGITLKKVNFKSSDFSGANLSSNAMTNASFESTKLTNANLESADLIGTNFSKAGMKGFNISNAIVDSTTILPNSDYRGAKLVNINLGDRDMSDTVFANADLSGITFSGKLVDTEVGGANFTGAKLSHVAFAAQNGGGQYFSFSGTNFSGVNLGTCSFVKCHLAGMIIDKGTIVSNCNFEQAILRNTDFSILSNKDWGTANISGTQFVGVNFGAADLSKVTFGTSPPTLQSVYDGSTLKTRLSLAGATLQKSMLGQNWKGFDFSQATILGTAPFTFSSKDKPLLAQEAKLNSLVTSLDNADFNYADMTDAEMTGISLNGAKFANAKLVNAYLMMTKLNNAWLLQANLSGAYLTAKKNDPAFVQGPVATAAQLSKAYMMNATLDNAHFDGTTLNSAIMVTSDAVSGKFSAKKASFVLSDMNDALLVEGTFDEAVFTAANLSAAKLINASFLGANFEPSEQADGKRANLSKADIRGTHFAENANGQGQPALMQGANLDGAKFTLTAGRDRYRFEIPDPTDSKKKTALKGICNITYLGVTDGSTTCPVNGNGPCKLT